MLYRDADNLLQRDYEYLSEVCFIWMQHYNFMFDYCKDEVDEFYNREHFNEYKFYDV